MFRKICIQINSGDNQLLCCIVKKIFPATIMKVCLFPKFVCNKNAHISGLDKEEHAESYGSSSCTNIEALNLQMLVLASKTHGPRLFYHRTHVLNAN